MRTDRLALVAALALGAALAAAGFSTGQEAQRPAGLRSPRSFDAIPERAARSAALFGEASRALLHPRCVNCHPAGDQPLQGSGDRVHEPPVVRAKSGMGVVGMQCATCHGRENFDPGRMPGAPLWRLAPRSMAWQGLTPAQLCAQLKDPARNGNRTLAEVADHLRNDELVAWGWSPGSGREPAPGSQLELAALIDAWIATGGDCPE
jgi:cytochrome c553